MRPSIRTACTLATLVALTAATACVPDPPVTPSPYACAATPVSLGAGDSVTNVSANGNLVVITEYTDGGSPFVYSVVDRAAGTRRSLGTGLAGSDGATFWSNSAGTALVIYRFEPRAAGVPAWSRYDSATGTITPLTPDLGPSEYIAQVSDDLTTVLVEHFIGTNSSTYRKLSLVDGSSTPVSLSRSAGLDITDVSRSLDRAARTTTSPFSPATLTVVDIDSDAVVATVGPIVRSGSYTAPIFIDDGHLLVGHARPATEPSDGLTYDDAFVADLTSGATTRIDPGVAGGATKWSTPDGSRSVYTASQPPPVSTWVRGVEADATLLVEGLEARTDADVTLAVTASGGEVTLTCF